MEATLAVKPRMAIAALTRLTEVNVLLLSLLQLPLTLKVPLTANPLDLLPNLSLTRKLLQGCRIKPYATIPQHLHLAREEAAARTTRNLTRATRSPTRVAPTTRCHLKLDLGILWAKSSVARLWVDRLMLHLPHRTLRQMET